MALQEILFIRGIAVGFILIIILMAIMIISGLVCAYIALRGIMENEEH